MAESGGAESGERDDPLEPVPEPLLLVSCSRCEHLHHAAHPLAFNPVCSSCSTLRSLEMSGCHPLTTEAIDEILTRTSPGNYALGYMDDTSFVVFYVGRSDSDLRRRLHGWVGFSSRCRRYAAGGKASWASRCRGPLPVGVPMLGDVAAGADTSDTHFAYSYAATADAAFERQCQNYEDFGRSRELDNRAYPKRTAEG